MNHLIAPSLLAADFSNLQLACEMVNQSQADLFHLDVMDGLFVPNISFGFSIIKTIYEHAQKPIDVHLMIVDPNRYLEQSRNAGADLLTIHYEACSDINQTVEAIKKLGMDVCVAIKPDTSVTVLNNIISDIHSVCVMSVEPGFGGQTFIEGTYIKVQELKDLIHNTMSNALIKVDGGVDMKNYQKLIDSGVNILVAGTSIFSSNNQLRTIEKIKEYARK